MKRFVIIVLLCGTVQALFAQNFTIDGIVKDEKNSKAIDFTTVVLQTKDSTLVATATTNQNGNFTFGKVSEGDYRIIVSSIGYTSQIVELPEVQASRSLGEIFLAEDAIMLEGATVAGSATSSHSDRKVVFPSERQVKASTNGVSLLQQLMLPNLQVNPLLNEVSLPGGGELQLRINGVQVELKEIVALQPEEVIRIEYHDNPGLRYGNAEVVLNYIVRRPETGGSFGVELNNGFDIPMWGNNSVYAKINHKKSEFSASYSYSHRDFKEVWRDNEEKFTYLDGTTLHRKEEGELGRWKMNWQYLKVGYSYAEPEKRMFNAAFRFWADNSPNQDFNGQLYNIADPTDRVDMVDYTTEKSYRPSLDLYYQENLKNNQTLVFNVVGTYNNSDFHRIYQEGKNGGLLTDINNKVEGDRYSIIGEGIYEKKLGKYSLSAGVRHTQSKSDNEYINGHSYNTEMQQAVTYAYAELKGSLKKLNYTAGVGVTRSWFKEGSEDYDDYTFNPRLVLHYKLSDKSFLRLNASLNSSNPSLANLSNVQQTIDSLQVQRGNPNLKPYKRYRVALTYEYKKGMFYGNWVGAYSYQPKAIMEEKFWEGGKIVQTWNNQKNWQRLESHATLRLGPIKEILQISATGGVNHYISNGYRYSHTYTNWYTDIDISATYKKFTAVFGLQTNYNWFYGETMSGGENVHYLMVQYTHKNLALTVGALNPFADNYKIDEENWSRYASYKKRNYVNESSRMFMFKINYSFSFGRRYSSAQKRLDNTDSESGVMSTSK